LNSRCLAVIVASLFLMVGVDLRAQPAPAPEPDDVERLLARIEHSLEAGDVFGYLDLVAGTANRARAIDFSRSEIQPGATRAVIKERDRIPFGSSVSPDGYRLVVDVFVEFGQSGREATWRLDVQRLGGVWQIFDAERLTVVERLYRISLDGTRQFQAEPDRQRRGSRPRARYRPCVLRVVRRGRDGGRARRSRRNAISSAARDREGPGEDLLRQRDARRSVHGGVRQNGPV
jgi:hypothetical protein